jgi:hypothetical protein
MAERATAAGGPAMEILVNLAVLAAVVIALEAIAPRPAVPQTHPVETAARHGDARSTDPLP